MNQDKTEKRMEDVSFSVILENMSDGVLFANPATNKFEFANQAICRMLGYEEEEINNLSVHDIHPKEDLDYVLSQFEAQARKEIDVAKDIPCLRKDGTVVYMDVNAGPINIGDKALLMGLFRDVTEQRREREKEKELTAQLVQSSKLAELGELIAGVAHELNQPLNGIKIISQSILRDIERGQFEKENLPADLEDVVNQVNKMSEIIDHMRRYSRRTDEMLYEKVDLNTVVTDMLRFLGQQLLDHNIRLVKEFSPQLPTIVGDPIRIEQVIMNLVTNARNALEISDKADKRIEIKTYRERGTDSGRKDAVVVEVKDNGEGISEMAQKKIFQPFFTTKPMGKGTGLGLSISKKIMEEHNGVVEWESKTGAGTAFKLIFPIAKFGQ